MSARRSGVPYGSLGHADSASDSSSIAEAAGIVSGTRVLGRNTGSSADNDSSGARGGAVGSVTYS
ncbi:hypothetical protein ACFCX0_26935 [Streptomyces sp. NPDC056352]|uniref:hypothetical protein n=1 Tax=Streptomyces sp. NPDC056352 TaxID=3345791 RepID=UPI0035DFC076